MIEKKKVKERRKKEKKFARIKKNLLLFNFYRIFFSLTHSLTRLTFGAIISWSSFEYARNQKRREEKKKLRNIYESKVEKKIKEIRTSRQPIFFHFGNKRRRQKKNWKTFAKNLSNSNVHSISVRSKVIIDITHLCCCWVLEKEIKEKKVPSFIKEFFRKES